MNLSIFHFAQCLSGFLNFIVSLSHSTQALPSMIAQLKRKVITSIISQLDLCANNHAKNGTKWKLNKIPFVQLVGRVSEGCSIAWNHQHEVQVTNYSPLLIDSAGNISSFEGFRCCSECLHHHANFSTVGAQSNRKFNSITLKVQIELKVSQVGLND